MNEMLRQMGGMQALQNMGPKALVEFKAGKMNYDGRMVTPDRRKGLLRVVEDGQGMKQF
jgi:26S proteasome regulatory subunit N13